MDEQRELGDSTESTKIISQEEMAARKRLLDLYGEQIEWDAEIDFEASEEEFCAQLRQNLQRHERQRPAVETAEAEVRRLSTRRVELDATHLAIGRRAVRAQMRPQPRTRPQRSTRRTSIARAGTRRARAPSRIASGSDDDPEPDVTSVEWRGLAAASTRLQVHLERRQGARRAA